MHCTALTKGEKFLHNKISYEIYSEAGTYHKQHGIENQDAIKVGMKDDYFFCAISDLQNMLSKQLTVLSNMLKSFSTSIALLFLVITKELHVKK